MTRVWFNHWFSTAYNIINLLKEENPGLIVIGSNQREQSVIKNVCDEWYIEPALEGDNYIDFCINFCQEHNIDVFIPRRNLVEVSKNISRFHAIDVKVMVDQYELIRNLNRKDYAYNLFRDNSKIHVPEFEVVKTKSEFEKAYEKLNKKYSSVCFKLVQDEGGMSFRKIDNTIEITSTLLTYPSTRMSYETVMDVLQKEEEFRERIIMPYLPGNEISVDCLRTEDGIIAVPRVKGCSRDEKVEFDEDILQMCYEILKKVPLEYPCNIQFKYLDDIPYFLEVNTRMSGGIQMSCLAAGVNIPDIALNKLLGVRKTWNINKGTKIVSYIEIPKLIMN